MPSLSVPERVHQEIEAFARFQLESLAQQQLHHRFLGFVQGQGPHIQESTGEHKLTFYDYTGFQTWDVDADMAAFGESLLNERDWRTAENLEKYVNSFLEACFSMDGFLQESGNGLWNNAHEKLPFAKTFNKIAEVKSVLTQRHTEVESLFGKLLESGVSELYAEMIVQQFETIDYWHPAQPSKNVVYHIGDKQGNKKVLKFVPAERKAEADIEAVVLREFKKHSILQQYVPAIFASEPIQVTIGNYSFAFLVEEDVTCKSSAQPVEYWLKALAQVHHYATKIMDKIGNYKQALRLVKDKDEARLEENGLQFDKVLRKDIAQESIENGDTFIHQDIRRQNRVGKYIIDWGHSGRGNPYLDLARVLLDSQLQQHQLYGQDDYKKSLALYVEERKKLAGETVPVSAQDVEAAYVQFNKIGLLYAQSQLAYLQTKGTLCTLGEIKDSEFLDFMRLNLETKLQRRRN